MTRDIKGANADWYQSGYRKCYYSGALGVVYRTVHRVMESRYKENDVFPTILEVGAGNGEHFAFIKSQFEKYIMSDIDISGLRPFVDKPNVEVRMLDCADLKEFKDGSIDRVIATCLLVHVEKPFESLREWRRVVVKGGNLTFYVALEPAWILRIIRRLFIWPKSRSLGAENPEILAYSEHKNHYPAMRAYIKDIFKNDSIKRVRYPFLLPWNFAFFDIYHITKE